jgi:signal peptidase
MDSQNLDESQSSEQELGSSGDELNANKADVAQSGSKEETTEAKAKAEKRSAIVHRIFTIIGIVLCVILIPILIINCIMIVKSFINKEDVPGVLGYKPMIVLTDSMFPVIEKGDIIISEEIDPKKVEIGDVISFKDPVSFNGKDDFSVVTHRVVDITKDEEGKLLFITKGDFNNTYDKEPVPAANLVGVYEDINGDSIKEVQVGDLITFWHEIPVDEELKDPAADENATEKEEYEYIDNKECLTYKVKEIKGDKFIVEKEFTYSVYETLEVDKEDVIGIYTESRRFSSVGHVAMFMQSTTGFIVCVFVPIILLVGYDLIRRKIHDKGTKKDKDALLAELERLRAEKAANEKTDLDDK